jgi:hypothetical protein
LYLVKNLSKNPFFTPYFGGRLRGAQAINRRMVSVKTVSLHLLPFQWFKICFWWSKNDFLGDFWAGRHALGPPQVANIGPCGNQGFLQVPNGSPVEIPHCN